MKQDYLDSLQRFAGRKDDVPRNVVLVLVDCLRARNVGCCGSPYEDTPNLDAVGAQGFVFRKAFAQVPHTQPSTASLVTSLYASVHGINTPENRFDPQTICMGEIFRAAGYDTSAFIANPHINPRSGHLEGIQYFSDGRSPRQRANSRFARWGEDSAVLNRDFFNWFRRHHDPGKPFFSLLFYIDAHNPYTSLPNVFHRFLNKKLYYPDFIRNSYSDAELAKIEALYRNRIRKADDSIGRLAAFLKSQRVWQNTVFVVTADHGDGLDRRPEHWLHGGLYEKGVHVPLIASVPWLRQSPRVFDHLVESIDILPALLELLNLPAPSQFQGKSFAPLLCGDAYEARQYAAGEYNYNRYIRTARWKYINNSGGILGARPHSNGDADGAEEVYEPEADSDEYRNLVSEIDPGELDGLRTQHEEFLQTLKGRTFQAETYRVEEDVLARLRGLGYID